MSITLDTKNYASGVHHESAPGQGPGAAENLVVVKRKHWGRWIVAGLLAFVLLQFVVSLFRNPRW
ncbi:MAG: hypothetical protein ACTII7_03440, partial [Galactobacter sp.]